MKKFEDATVNSRASSFQPGETDAGGSDAELSDCEVMTLNYFEKEDRRKKGKKSINWANFGSAQYFGHNFLHSCPIRTKDPNSESSFRGACCGKPSMFKLVFDPKFGCFSPSNPQF